MFNVTSLNEVFQIECEVVDSALLSPHNSFINTNEHYLISVDVSSTDIIDQIERVFSTYALPHLEVENVWKKGKYTIDVTTLVQPRLPVGQNEEYRPSQFISVAAKLDIVKGDDKAIERILLVSALPFAAECSQVAESEPDSIYNF